MCSWYTAARSGYRCILPRVFSNAVLRTRLLLAAGCLLIGGCRGSKVETVPVSGVVTLDREPVANIFVNFQPVLHAADDVSQSPGSYGITDGDGRFKLKTPDSRGAVVGEHVVTLVYKDPNRTDDLDPAAGREPPRHFKLPPRARDGSIRFTVPEDGTDEADFSFESREMRPAVAGRSSRF